MMFNSVSCLSGVLLILASAMVEGVRSTLYKSIAASGSDAWWVNAGGRELQELTN